MAFTAVNVWFALSLISVLGTALFVALFFLGARRAVRTDAPYNAATDAPEAPAGGWPAVTVLKPCAGSDDELERCLESYCAVDYPALQVVFGVRDERDAACAVIRQVISRHPERDLTLVFSGEGRHPSPKVSNLEVMSTRTKHALVWLTDSNTRVHPGTLKDMVLRLHAPGVGAVVSPVTGQGERTAGAALDALQLTALIAMTTYAAHGATGLVTAPGKSVLLRGETLAALGSWDELGKYFGEDFILMDRVRKLGQQLALGRHLVANVTVGASTAKFLARHLRWSQIRWRVIWPATLLEPMLSPLVITLLALLCAPSLRQLALLGVGALAQLVFDLSVLRRLRGHGLAWRFVPLVLARPLAIFWLWARGLFSGRVDWRGNVLYMGPQSMCLSEPPLRARLRALGLSR